MKTSIERNKLWPGKKEASGLGSRLIFLVSEYNKILSVNKVFKLDSFNSKGIEYK